MTAIKIIGSVVFVAAIAAAIGIFVPAEYFVSRNPREIDYYGDATRLKLRRYEVTGLPYEIRSWLEGPHDGAFGQEIAHAYLNWGIEHPEDFVYITEGVHATKREHIAEWLCMGVEDWTPQGKFLEQFQNKNEPIVSEIRNCVLRRQRLLK